MYNHFNHYNNKGIFYSPTSEASTINQLKSRKMTGLDDLFENETCVDIELAKLDVGDIPKLDTWTPLCSYLLCLLPIIDCS
jgi:hypothetical protein